MKNSKLAPPSEANTNSGSSGGGLLNSIQRLPDGAYCGVNYRYSPDVQYDNPLSFGSGYYQDLVDVISDHYNPSGDAPGYYVTWL